MALVFLVVTKAAEFKELIQDGFGNHIILFFIGVLIFSAAISNTKLMNRLATLLLHKLGDKPRLIILAFLSMGAMLSACITDMAVAAMLFPIGMSIAKNAGLIPLQSNFARSLLISCAWGPLIGGVATPAGCGPNPLTIGFLSDLAGVDFTFWEWMVIGCPASLLMLPAAWIVLLKVFPIEQVDLAMSAADYQQRKEELGSMTRQEIVVSVVFVLMVFLWVAAPRVTYLTGGAIDYLSVSFVAVACSCLLFLPKLTLNKS